MTTVEPVTTRCPRCVGASVLAEESGGTADPRPASTPATCGVCGGRGFIRRPGRRHMAARRDRRDPLSFSSSTG